MPQAGQGMPRTGAATPSMMTLEKGRPRQYGRGVLVHYVKNPPDAAALMTSARSFGNYDLPSALSDLIDNSIKAKAKGVRLTCLFNAGKPHVSVLDDGSGMTADELEKAMRPASTNPLMERPPDDLGRFGWGLKSASFSQCRCLTVISVKNRSVSGACWDLKDVDNWRMGVLSQADIDGTATSDLLESDSGTEVIWSDCDRLSENGELTEEEFNALIVHAKGQIALTFHKYLSGKVPGKKLAIYLNGQPLKGYDPFYRDHDATQDLEIEEIRIGHAKVRIQPFILPHYSKLGGSEYERLGGEEGFIKNQGFYVYRNHRLIIHGTWFRLVKHGEMSQLVRVSVDLPNTLDFVWKITLDKADAQLPAALRSRLRDIVERLKGRSSKVFRSKGGRLDLRSSVPVWSRYARNGEITYWINREHPVVAAVLATSDDGQKEAISAALKIIEQGFPVTAFGGDVSANVNAIHQTEGDPKEFLAYLEAVLPLMLAKEGGDLKALVQHLQTAEPFNLNWKLVRDLLLEKGWIDGKA
jgi:hypothetical protein